MSKKKKQSKQKQKSTTVKSGKTKVVATKKEQLAPTKAKSRSATTTSAEVPLLYGRKNFMLILGGIGLMALGMLLMSGGNMPSPDVWDESIIYGFRRITLAPIAILLGLGLVLYSIFAPAKANV